MTTSDLQSLTDRVERLENQYHWSKSEVVTERLVLMDADGKTRATLCMSEGVPNLVMFDPNGKVRLTLAVFESGASLYMSDANGKKRLSLDVTPFFESSVPELTMWGDPNGLPTVIVTAHEKSAAVCLFGANNPDRNTSAVIEMSNEGPRLLCIKDGKVLWSAP